MQELKLKKGTVIFKVGDKGDQMYAITEGSVGIYVNYGESNEKCLVTLTAGKYFGEMAVVEKTVRSATAVVVEDATLVEYKAESLPVFLTENAEISAQILTNLSARLRGLTQDYMEACRTLSELAQTKAGQKALKKLEKAELKAENGEGEKKGLWSRIQHFAEVYADSMDTYAGALSANPSAYMGINGPFFF